MIDCSFFFFLWKIMFAQYRPSPITPEYNTLTNWKMKSIERFGYPPCYPGHRKTTCRILLFNDIQWQDSKYNNSRTFSALFPMPFVPSVSFDRCFAWPKTEKSNNSLAFSFFAFCAQKRVETRIPSREGCISSIKMENNTSEELAILQFITDLDLDFISNKRVHLCPHCGKMLSGLTSYQRHLVSKVTNTEWNT